MIDNGHRSWPWSFGANILHTICPLTPSFESKGAGINPRPRKRGLASPPGLTFSAISLRGSALPREKDFVFSPFQNLLALSQFHIRLDLVDPMGCFAPVLHALGKSECPTYIPHCGFYHFIIIGKCPNPRRQNASARPD